MRIAQFVIGCSALVVVVPFAWQLLQADDKGAPQSRPDAPRQAVLKVAPATPATPAIRIAPTAKLVPAVKVAAPAPAVAVLPGQQPTDIDEKATHEQKKLIELKRDANDSMTVNAFCLDAQGMILAACGGGPGEIRRLDGDGKFVSAWSVSVKPESISSAPDGTVLVAGDGKLFRFAADGKLLKEAASPHVTALQEKKEQLREEARKNFLRSFNSVATRIETYEQIIASLKERQAKNEKLEPAEEQILKVLPAQLETLKKQQAAAGEKKQPEIDEARVEAQVAALTKQKSRMASISSDGRNVFVATPALVGYGYEVWRMTTDFEKGEVIVTGLSGCCGQMDVQVSETGVYVAENSRHRVVRYQGDGKLIASWGKADRTGVEGFTSCCNPMNVCFNKAGDVYTAESNTGRIKRFTAAGEFIEFVGDIKLVPGCKNVSIAVTPDGARVYMLDLTRNHIVLMERKAADAAAATKAEAGKS